MDLDFFEIFAECSIAFAGFGAVHAALRGASGPRGVFRAWSVVMQGSLSFVLSILPLLAGFLSLSEDLLWRGASLFGVAGGLSTTWTFVVLDVRMTRLGHPPQAPVSIRMAQTFSVLATLTMLGNVVGWPWSPQPMAYALALTFILATGLLALLHSFLVPLQIVFGREDPDDPGDRPAA